MHFQLKKTITHVTVLSALIPALSALAADGANMDPGSAPKRGEYVYDSIGTNVRSGFAQTCVTTGFWTPETSTPECHPDLFAAPGQPAPKSAQEAAPQTAAPVQPEPSEPGYEPAPYEEPTAETTAPATAEEPMPEFVQEPAEEFAAEPESFESGSADTAISPPVVFAEGEEGVAQDEGIESGTRYYEEEEGVARDDGIIAHEIYSEEEEGVAKDDGIIGHNIYNEDDEGAAKDDGITAQSIYDEEEAAPEEEVVTSQSFEEEDSAQQPEELISEPEQEQAAQPEEQAAQPEEQAAQPEEQAAQPEEQAAAAPTEQTQESVAQAEEQKPAPVTMLPVTITVEADPLFDFDKYAMRSDSRKKLDDLVEQLKGVTYGEILAVGFADPIGSSIYNENLSKRRAASVKSYLVSKGIPADNIKTEGRGETQEYASFESCVGMRKQKLITCLQPDRRVEVTVTAEKEQ